MYFAWKNEYSMEIKTIDDQHKKLFEIGRRVSDYVFSNDLPVGREEVVSILLDLKAYTEFHFKFEEKLMAEYGYPYYGTHKNEHDMIIGRIQKLEDGISDLIQKETLMELINFIFEWISKHILKDDKKYKGYFTDMEDKE